MKLDRHAMIRTVETRLAALEGARQRRNLEMVLEHMRAEVACDIDRLLATLSPRVAYHTYGVPDRCPVGHEGVRAFYERLADEGHLYLEFDIDRLAVDEHVVVTEGVMRALVPTRSLAQYGMPDDGGVQLLVNRMAVFWPFDEDGLILGEDTYSSFLGLEPVTTAELPADYPYLPSRASIEGGATQASAGSESMVREAPSASAPSSVRPEPPMQDGTTVYVVRDCDDVVAVHADKAQAEADAEKRNRKYEDLVPYFLQEAPFRARVRGTR